MNLSTYCGFHVKARSLHDAELSTYACAQPPQTLRCLHMLARSLHDTALSTYACAQPPRHCAVSICLRAVSTTLRCLHMLARSLHDAALSTYACAQPPRHCAVYICLRAASTTLSCLHMLARSLHKHCAVTICLRAASTTLRCLHMLARSLHNTVLHPLAVLNDPSPACATPSLPHHCSLRTRPPPMQATRGLQHTTWSMASHRRTMSQERAARAATPTTLQPPALHTLQTYLQLSKPQAHGTLSCSPVATPSASPAFSTG
jgi:hypothetical protein